MLRPLLTLSAMAALMSCKGSSDDSVTGTKIEPIPAQEVERGKKACQTYVDRVCACAQTQPQFEEECKLSKGRPQALETNLEIAAAAGLKPHEQQAVKAEINKIIAACFKADGNLPLDSCPR